MRRVYLGLVMAVALCIAAISATPASAGTTPFRARVHVYDGSAASRDHAQRLVATDAVATATSTTEGLAIATRRDGTEPNDVRSLAPRFATNSADDVAGLADEALGAGDAMASRYLKAMSDSPVDIPQGWAPRVADNGKGVVFQRPGATGNADMIRVMDPTPRYPTGYIRIHNSSGQPVDLAGKTGPASATHIPR